MVTEVLARFFDTIGVEWVMILLLLLSVASVYVICERFLFYRRRRVNVSGLARAIEQALATGDREAAIARAESEEGMEARVVAAGLHAMPRGVETVEEVIQGAIVTERIQYDRSLSFLGTLGNNAPFIGLFGTVLGIIRAFADLAAVAEGADRAKAIMGSIAEALVATAIGLLVAIPAVLAYNAFRGVVRGRVGNTEALSRVLMASLKETPSEGA